MGWIWDDIAKRNEIAEFLRETYPDNEREQLFGITDINQTFRQAPAGQAGEMMLATMVHMTPAADRAGVEQLANIIRNDPELSASFDALARDEGMNTMTQLETLMTREDGTVDASAFSETLSSGANRSLLAQAFRQGATGDHDMEDVVGFATSAVAFGREQNPENERRFRERARNLGVDLSQVESQQMMESFRNFMRDPAGTLAELGIPADIIAMLEPFLRFFTGSADYYMNGAPGQRGLNQIGADMADGVRTRTAEIQRDHPNVEAPVFFTSAGARQVDADGAPAVRSQFDHARTGTVIEPGADRQTGLARDVTSGWRAAAPALGD